MTFNQEEILKIFLKSAKNATKFSLWKWLLTGSIGALSGTFTFGKNFFGLTLIDSIIYALVVIASLYLLRFILIFIKESLKYFHEIYKNSVYGDAIILLKDGFSLTHHYRKTPGHQDKEFMQAIIALCNNLQTIFNKIIGDDCSVSIKVPIQDKNVNEKTVLMNLTRDINHQNRDTQKYIQTKHSLIGNTGFIFTLNKVITNSNDKYYINNQINQTKNYLNTSKECYENEILPYNSELIVPIIPIINDSSNNNNTDCLGFICIDSVKNNAFTTKYDLAIVQGVADGIYDLISERNKNINQEN